MMTTIFWAMVQALWLILFAPLVAGIMKKTKAFMQGREGPRVLQPYYDLFKYLRKDALFSTYSSWISRFTPYILFSVTLASGLLLPLFYEGLPLMADFLIFIYLLALGRFFTALAALDTGSAFGGMGASRELALNTIIEPAFLLSILALIISAGSTSFHKILDHVGEGQFFLSLPYFLMMFAILFVILGETGKIPIDNADTHLELTMIHDGMTLEYSGRYYGLMLLSSQMKQVILMSVFMMIFFPLLFWRGQVFGRLFIISSSFRGRLFCSACSFLLSR